MSLTESMHSVTAIPNLEHDDVTLSKRASSGGAMGLLAGRFLALFLNLCVQVLVVRFFTKLDYGAFAFALSVISIAATALALGMDKTLGRYVAIYHQSGDLPKLFGSIGVAISLILSLGSVLVGCAVVASLAFGIPLLGDSLTSGLLLLLILLAPLNALDSILVALFGVFNSPGSIVWRRHVVGPLLKLGSVVTVITMSGNIYWLAAGHAIALTLGAVLSALLLIRLFRRDQSLRSVLTTRWEYPTRELLGHSLPLMSTDVVMLLRSSLAIIFLEFMNGNVGVAEYRSVSPLARLNEVVVTTLAVLFIPAAARLFANRDGRVINAMYWGTASTLAVLAFPIFAATFVISEPLTVLLLGEQYRSSSTILRILAFAYYFHTSLGFNSQMLRVYGRVRCVVITDVVAACVAVLGYLLLIPAYGPMGAALSTAGSLVLHNLLNQWWLVRTTDVKSFDLSYVGTLASIVLATLFLVGTQHLLTLHLITSLSVTAVVSLTVLVWNRNALELDEIASVLSRVPLFHRLVSSPS